MAWSGKNANGLRQPREEINVKYMHRPPLITPNYGNPRRSMLPKSKVSRVLLYDNATQDHMLDIKLAHINIEKERINRTIDLHKRSFSSRQIRKQEVKKQLVSNHSSIETISSNTMMKSKNGLAHTIQEDVPSLKNNEISIENIKLPKIDPGKRQIIFRIQCKNGKTELYHTVDENHLISDLIPLKSSNWYPKYTDDPRFKSLQKLLVPLDN